MAFAGPFPDSTEDPETTAAELKELFGGKVTTIVLGATGDKSLHMQVHKQRRIEHVLHFSPQARRVKPARPSTCRYPCTPYGLVGGMQ